MTELTPRERVERAYEKGYRVTEDGRPVNANGKPLTGSTANTWGIAVWMDGRGEHVSVAQLSARCHWDEDRYEEAMDAIEAREDIAILPVNGDPLDMRPGNLVLKKRPRGGKLTREHEHQIVEKFDDGASKSSLAREYGVNKTSVYYILDKHDRL